MKGRLWVKLTLAFMTVILLGALVMAGIIQQVTANQFHGFINAGDRGLARQLRPVLEAAFLEQRDWGEVQDVLSRSALLLPPMPPDTEGGQRRGMMGRMGMTGMMSDRWDHGMAAGLISRILITDPRGLVVVDNSGEELGKRLEADFLERGVPLTGPDGPLGRLFIDSMVSPMLSPLGEQFLDRIRQATFVSVLVMVVVSLGAVILLAKNITAPLGRMGLVAGRIARGEFEVRTGIRRSDELGDLGRSVDEMAASLQRAEEGKRRLIADSAHELRTPMTLIQGNLEMILDGVYDSSRERLEMIYRETELMSRLIGDLQDLASWEAGNVVLQRRRLSLEAVNREVMTSFRSQWENLGAEMILSEGEGGFVTGDPVRLKQVFLNLYSNALRYLPRNGRLEVAFFETDAEVTVSMGNNGPALSEDLLELIFERFYRVDTSRNRSAGGRGLGLSIAKEIVAAHGGRIWAENLPHEGGVRFSFSLPKK